MAAVLIAGVFLSATLQVTFDRLTSHQITYYSGSRKLKDGLLKKLHFTLISINQVFEDVEEMLHRNPSVKQWLEELKHAVYEAEDSLDEIGTEAEKHKLKADIQTVGTKVKNFFTSFANLFDKEIKSRLKEVLDNLNSLAKQKDVLRLKEGTTTGSVVVFGGKTRLPTTSFVNESSMYGRDGDKEKLVNFLLSGDVCTKQPHGSFLDQLVFTEAYIEELGFANSLWRLWIKAGHQSVMPFSLGLFPNLQSLFLFDFPNLYAFPISTSTYPYFMSLAHLYFSECPKLVSFPVGGLYGPKLEYMHTLLPSLKYLALINCQELELLPLGGFPVCLTRFVISFCSKLFASRKEWGLQNLHSLICFRISHDFETAESFPEESLLPPNITKLNLWNCSKLKSINYKVFLHLRSLQFLWIDNCPVLQCLPKEALPKTLSSLEIKGSPLLELRCQREKSQDWHKISHIPHILIGDTLMT